MTKITKLEFTEVIIPARKGSVNSKGVYKPLHMLPVNKSAKAGWQTQFDELPKLLLELHLEDGTVGLGEFYRDHNWEVVESIARSLLGAQIEKLPLQRLPIGLFREYDGFECAIWDAACRLRKMSLVQMLGGALQEKVKIGAWSSYRPLKEMGDFAAEKQQKGFDTLKLKCSLEDDVVGWAKEIAKKASKMMLILDPNQRWENLGEARKIVSQLEQVGNVFCLEDPIPFWMISEYKELKNYTNIRLVRHISIPYIYQGQREHQLIEFLKAGACDGFNFNGGIAAFARLERTAAMANLYCWHGSEVDLGVLEAKYLHSIAASTHCIWASDVFGRAIRQHDGLKTPLTIKPPFAYLPEGLGLGVELDKNTLKKYQTKSKVVE
jgi:muconate cycloisomerase